MLFWQSLCSLRKFKAKSSLCTLGVKYLYTTLFSQTAINRHIERFFKTLQDFKYCGWIKQDFAERLNKLRFNMNGKSFYCKTYKNFTIKTISESSEEMLIIIIVKFEVKVLPDNMWRVLSFINLQCRKKIIYYFKKFRWK